MSKSELAQTKKSDTKTESFWLKVSKEEEPELSRCRSESEPKKVLPSPRLGKKKEKNLLCSRLVFFVLFVLVLVCFGCFGCFVRFVCLLVDLFVDLFYLFVYFCCYSSDPLYQSLPTTFTNPGLSNFPLPPLSWPRPQSNQTTKTTILIRI